jgi:very-short-patch-repair endonuclease/L-amino acid N-acyltransferase YncA
MLTVRPVEADDAAELAELLNAVIAAGGTTALEVPFTPEGLAETYLTGPNVLCCFVAEDDDGTLLGFQTLGRTPGLPDDVGDIATFAAVGATRRGIGSELLEATGPRAVELGLTAINATIRSDNVGGLAFYAGQGFEDHSVTEGVPLRDGTLVDRVHKRLALASEDTFEGEPEGAFEGESEGTSEGESESPSEGIGKKRLSIRPPAERAAAPALQKKGRGWAITESRLDTLHESAREMRRNPTQAQTVLAEALAAADAGGFKFRRQVVIGSAIVAFACQPLKIAIELDEDADIAPEVARRRDKSLAEVGIKLLRYPALAVLNDVDSVVGKIIDEMKASWAAQRARPRTNYGPRR